MTVKELVDRCGTIQVRAAPLLMLIGAVISIDKGPDLETIVEMLDPPGAEAGEPR